MKIMTILGTRPEIIRLSRIIPLLDNLCEHVLVHTALRGKTFFLEIVLSLWIILNSYVWVVLNAYPDRNVLPSFCQNVIKISHDFIWPYVWRQSRGLPQFFQNPARRNWRHFLPSIHG